MKRKLLLIAALVLVALSMAIFLGAGSSPKKEAALELARRFAVEASDVQFEPQRYRGVVCGRFRMKSDARPEVWRRFVYISHYSAGAPDRAELTIDTDPAARELFARFECR
jgi:hypothetical protein